MQRWGHCIVSKFECNICPERFESVTLCKSHEVNEHHHCRDCDRDFISLNNIKQVGRGLPVCGNQAAADLTSTST